ncbi:hypothetical protein Q3G72_005987 [Acer saccharum]|nr:hypothetical protein Q3G72_005987 [Acer saccharum]
MWSAPCASGAMSMAFYMLGFIIPTAFRLELLRRKDSACTALGAGGWLHLVARDISVAALVCWVGYVFEPMAAMTVNASLLVVVGLMSLLTCVDVMLMREIGARFEPQLVSYAFELDAIGGARWRWPAFAAVGCAMLSMVATWLGHSIVMPCNALILFGLACCFIPLLVWEHKNQFDNLWRADGVLWRWASILCAAMFSRLRRRRSLVGPASVCIGPHEKYVLHDPAYPLWRDTHAWGSPRAVSWSMPQNSKPHVILIVMESMGAVDTGCTNVKPSITPCFDAWSERGLLYTQHYATGHSTSRSVMSLLYGVLPGLRARPTLIDENPAYLSGLPQLFAAHGYHTRYLQGAPLLFDDKRSYFETRGFAEVGGGDELWEMYPDAEEGAWSAPHDAYLFDAHATWLIQKAKLNEPTFSTLLTITNHDPWNIPRGWRGKDLADDAAYAAHMQSKDFSVVRARCELAMRYADAQLGLYLERLEKAGVLANAIVCIVGDTGQQYEDEQITTKVGGYLRDEAYHVPLLILAPHFLNRAQRFAHVTSQIDVQPTLMDLMGWHGPHHSMGQSLVRLPQRQAAHFTQPHSPRYLSLRAEQWRFNIALDGSRPSLFNVEQDPLERVNLAADEAARVEAFRAEAKTLQDVTTRLHQQDAFCPPKDKSAAARQQQLAGAVYLFAPDGLRIPESLAQLQAIIESPIYMQDSALVAYRVFAKRVLRSAIGDAQHLELLQLKLQQMYPDTFGEQDWMAIEKYTELYNTFAAAERQQESALLEQVQQALKRAPRLGG